MTATRREIVLEGRTVAYLELGSGRRTLLFHGFPDLPTTYLPMAEQLAARGHRCIAPWMRGYWPTDPGEHYDTGTLVADAVALIDALGLEHVCVVGHDWGADAAYGLSAARPDLVDAAVVLAVPHGAALGPNRLASFEQLRRSFYWWLFQLSALVRQIVPRDDFAFLWRLWREWSPGWEMPAEHRAQLLDTFRRPGVAEAAISYYRAVFDETLVDPARVDLREAAERPIEVPTLLLLGERDGCIGPEMAAGAENAFHGDYETRTLARCGHFPQLEHPDAVAELAGDWFDRFAQWPRAATPR